jgi:hypothetical protein
VHVKDDQVGMVKHGRTLEDECDGPALASAGATEQCGMALEELVAIGDRIGGPI